MAAVLPLPAAKVFQPYPRPVRDIHQIELTTRCGRLYKIDFKNGKSYVGITMLPTKKRLADHEYSAFSKRSPTCLHRAMRKYGRASYLIKTLVFAENFDYLKQLEIAAIKTFGTKLPLGYNMTGGGDGQLGKEWSAESREKLAAKRRGRDFLSPEARAAFGARFKGRVLSEEHKKKLSEAGRRRAPRVLGPMSTEHKAKIAAKARLRKQSATTKAKLSAIVKKWWLSKTDRRMSEKQKKKISLAHIAFWKKRRSTS